MFYNQNDYAHIPYPYNGDYARNVATSGCGPCSCCMVVEALTGQTFTPEEAVEVSFAAGARQAHGTEMSLLAPAVCQKFGLKYELTDDAGKVLQFLQEKRGLVVANAGGDREGWIGVFTVGGHYIVLAEAQGREITVWDPSIKPGKFDREGRRDKVRVEGNLVYADIGVIAKDCDNRTPAYTLFYK